MSSWTRLLRPADVYATSAGSFFAPRWAAASSCGQGEEPAPDACITLDAFSITGLPEGRPAGALVKVTFSHDTKGRVHVTAEDVDSGKTMTVEINRTRGMDPSRLTAEMTRLCLKSVE